MIHSIEPLLIYQDKRQFENGFGAADHNTRFLVDMENPSYPYQRVWVVRRQGRIVGVSSNGDRRVSKKDQAAIHEYLGNMPTKFESEFSEAVDERVRQLSE